MRRFPYSLYFRVHEAAIVVCGLFHFARDPRGIEKQLDERMDREP